MKTEADNDKIISISLNSQPFRFLNKLSKITSSKSETMRMSLYFAKKGLTTPKNIDGKYECSITLKLCQSLMPKNNHSEYARACLNGLEEKIDLENDARKEMIKTAHTVSTYVLENCYELAENYNISFSELARYSLFMHYYLNTPLRYVDARPYEMKSMTIPAMIYKKVDAEHNNKNCTINEIIQGSLSNLLQLEFGESAFSDEKKHKIEFFPDKLERLVNMAKCTEYLNEIKRVYSIVAEKTVIRRGAIAAIIYYTTQDKKDNQIIDVLAEEEKLKPHTIRKKAREYKKLVEESLN